MLTLNVKREVIEKEYPKDYERLLNILRNSGSKYKDTLEDEILFDYSISFFLKKGEYNEEYVEVVSRYPFEERYEHELTKVRVSVILNAKHFIIVDRVEGISDCIKEAIKYITAHKMEQEAIAFDDDSLLNTIPSELMVKEHEIEKVDEVSLEDQLASAIEDEDYIEAARIRDEIKKRNFDQDSI
jgi:hypothetical protein